MDVKTILKEVVGKGASDVFVVAGRPMSFKAGSQIESLSDEVFLPGQTAEFLTEIYRMAQDRDMGRLMDVGDDDFSFAVPEVSRFRVSAYKQRGSLAAVIRVVAFALPDPAKLNIPDQILGLSEKRHGLLLFTGADGSGKTTSVACLIDRINSTRNGHIITLENPIEYLHRHKMSLISQREISIDTESYADAMRSALRQSPNVILIGELNGEETISMALTAAETGHLVISTMPTVGATSTVDRLVDAFPAGQREQTRMRLSMVLQSVISQQLVPTVDGSVVPAFQVMHCNNVIRGVIRDGRTDQINALINSGSGEGMIDMDASILNMFKDGVITAQEALAHALEPENMARHVNTRDKMYF
ncbi:MAG: PilT/PilU family type 4a pilus ATPase [Clostridiales Family XIII bacterium]|jgi:twitching motility protein PilT|nr:PilT/PilU family type 4a pilus ATPase [Clostridiales Family XIII bacterium]